MLSKNDSFKSLYAPYFDNDSVGTLTLCCNILMSNDEEKDNLYYKVRWDIIAKPGEMKK